VDGVAEGNGLLALLRFVIFKKLEKDKRHFVINRPEKYGGKITFKTPEEVEEAFSSKQLASVDLKQGVAEELILLLKPLHEKIEKNKKLVEEAYPAN